MTNSNGDIDTNGSQRVTNAELRKDIAALKEIISDSNEETRRWRESMELRMRKVELDMVAHTAIEKTQPIGMVHPQKPDPEEDGIVTWTWVRDKIVQPIVIMFVAYLLITLLPKLIVLAAP